MIVFFSIDISLVYIFFLFICHLVPEEYWITINSDVCKGSTN